MIGYGRSLGLSNQSSNRRLGGILLSELQVHNKTIVDHGLLDLQAYLLQAIHYF